MKTKQSTLELGLLHKAAGKPQPVIPAKESPRLVLIGANWPPEVRKALKLAEAESGKGLKALLGEGINLICAKYGVAEPCPLSEG
jgi:hypothetical protein